MTPRVWTYLAQLARAMQQEGVDGNVAGDFIAEIDAHLAATDVDPADEFGPPAALAREVSGRTDARRSWNLRSPWWAIASGAVVFLFLIGALEGVRSGWGERIEITAGPAIQGLTIYTLSVGFGYLATRRLDGRTWAPLTGWRAWSIVGSIAVVGTTLATGLQDVVLITVSTTWFVGVASVVLPALILIQARSYSPIRFPPHAQHLKPLRRGLLADWFGAPQPRGAGGSPTR